MRTRNALTRGWRLTVREPLNLSHVRARVRVEKTIKRSLIMKPQMIDIDWTVVAAFTLVFVTYEFTSREIETSSGLYYNRARYYDPGARQFIQKDPAACAGDSTSRYAYVGDNPVNNKDPSGKFCFPCLKWCQQWWGGWLPCSWGCLNVDWGLFQGCMLMNGIAYGVTAYCLWGFFAYCLYAAILSFVAGAGPTGFFACAALYCGPALFAAAGCFLLSLQCS